MQRSNVRESTTNIEAEIRRKVRDQAEIDRGVQEQAEDVRDYWRDNAPVDEGAYAASIHVERRPSIDGMPRRAVVADDWKAHFIEFGTGEPGPTRAHNLAAKTAAHFGGTAGDGGAEVRA